MAEHSLSIICTTVIHSETDVYLSLIEDELLSHLQFLLKVQQKYELMPDIALIFSNLCVDKEVHSHILNSGLVTSAVQLLQTAPKRAANDFLYGLASIVLCGTCHAQLANEKVTGAMLDAINKGIKESERLALKAIVQMLEFGKKEAEQMVLCGRMVCNTRNEGEEGDKLVVTNRVLDELLDEDRLNHFFNLRRVKDIAARRYIAIIYKEFLADQLQSMQLSDYSGDIVVDHDENDANTESNGDEEEEEEEDEVEEEETEETLDEVESDDSFSSEKIEENSNEGKMEEEKADFANKLQLERTVS
ncbi:uncharacterized protein MONOS_6106 [Monocercomonoides exilis]|uniref:uncharacterized protein n=1 Tax=Monocercomonoides exilis TaxID=2049356 RepID=UPI003559706B|nr:hypothetical protein MONOS_6106 [Monocercomonoides exilis]|eukprot:MONOS_6106.1-p1 / transcript=MONOS_6106.1 / gene=MONOS_6106 / organism=Monocercomonoides_exilis_PA203 / gene_product=unspecified product / transcript_product=unspecified product / location=Mono_scaffold00188:31591-32607(-) / protein_length=304 / sequence_SO=supercontig / SO=protein_coding / is_pseudo=false